MSKTRSGKVYNGVDESESDEPSKSGRNSYSTKCRMKFDGTDLTFRRLEYTGANWATWISNIKKAKRIASLATLNAGNGTKAEKDLVHQVSKDKLCIC